MHNNNFTFTVADPGEYQGVRALDPPMLYFSDSIIGIDSNRYFWMTDIYCLPLIFTDVIDPWGFSGLGPLKRSQQEYPRGFYHDTIDSF